MNLKGFNFVFKKCSNKVVFCGAIMDCWKCGQKNIKYRYISCKTSICNICSVTWSDKTPCYSEENFLVGKCSECTCQVQGSHTTQNAAKAGKSHYSNRQTTLLGVFNKTPMLKKVVMTTPKPMEIFCWVKINLLILLHWNFICIWPTLPLVISPKAL